MLRREPIAYTTSESIIASSSFFVLAKFSKKDNLAMLFLQTAYFSLVSGCKYTLFFKNSCIISNNNNKMVYIPDNYIKPANLPVGIKKHSLSIYFFKNRPYRCCTCIDNRFLYALQGCIVLNVIYRVKLRSFLSMI